MQRHKGILLGEESIQCLNLIVVPQMHTYINITELYTEDFCTVLYNKQKQNLYILSRVGRQSCRIFLNRFQHIPPNLMAYGYFLKNFPECILDTRYFSLNEV